MTEITETVIFNDATRAYAGEKGHTSQLLRIAPDGWTFEFSIYRRRQRNKNGGCTTRIWLMQRFFESGFWHRGRITVEALEHIRSLHDEPEAQIIFCGELLTLAKQQTRGFESPLAAWKLTLLRAIKPQACRDAYKAVSRAIRQMPNDEPVEAPEALLQYRDWALANLTPESLPPAWADRLRKAQEQSE